MAKTKTKKQKAAEATTAPAPPLPNSPESAAQASKLPPGTGNRLDEPDQRDIRLTQAPAGGS